MSFDSRPSTQQVYADGRAGRARFLVTLASFVCALAFTAAIFAGSPAAAEKLRETIDPGPGPAAGTTGAPVPSVNSAAAQAFGWYTRYTLRLDIGGEQSVEVMAPPGGLQLTVRDMTGDRIPNDVVVTPALLHWPLTVLVNDGNNHFTVAISAKLPDSSASSEDQASGMPASADLSALVSPRFKPHAVSNRGGVLLPPRQEELLATSRIPSSPPHAIASSPGRAPPAFRTNT